MSAHRIALDPESWPTVPDDPEVAEHVYEMRGDDTNNRLNFFYTDDGWCVHVTHSTAGACDAVGQTFMLPASVSDALADLHRESEDRIIWRSGIGLQVEVDVLGASGLVTEPETQP